MHRLVLPLADGLTDNWCALETCLWGFQLVGIGSGVCLNVLVWEVWSYRDWPGMSYMLILSECE